MVAKLADIKQLRGGKKATKGHKSTFHVAYDLLIAAIENGNLSPGSRLREVELADWLGISRTPVREALKRLETQGLITHEPNHGAIVTVLDYSKTVELYLVREVLEGTAARLAAIQATDSELSILRAMVKSDRKFLSDPAELTKRNRAFHKQVQLMAKNHFLNVMLDNMRISQILLTGTTLKASSRAAELLDEHQAIVDAIASRAPEEAEAAARLHVRNAFTARIKYIADTGQ